MALLQEAIPTLKETTIAFTANSEFQFNRTCQFLSIINLTGEVEVSINDNDYTAARGGITYKMPPEAQIYSMRFRETAGAVANLTIATGNGDIFDNRASFAGNLPVVNAASPDDSLQVDLLAADAGLVALSAAIIAGLQASVDLRPRFQSLTGLSFVESRNSGASPTTLVTSGTNTAGIIVHSAWCSRTNTDQDVYVAINDGAIKHVCGWRDTGASHDQHGLDRIEYPILVPDGVSLTYHAESTGGNIAMWYEVL